MGKVDPADNLAQQNGNAVPLTVGSPFVPLAEPSFSTPVAGPSSSITPVTAQNPLYSLENTTSPLTTPSKINDLPPESVPDEPLPAYSEIAPGQSLSPTPHDDVPHQSLYNPEASPPPFSTYIAEKSQHYFHDSIISFDSHLNTDGEALYRFLLEQAKFPPLLGVRIRGTHTKTKTDYQGRVSYETVTDFDFCLDLSGCLFEVVMRDEVNGGKLTLVKDNQETHRGGVVRTRKLRENGDDSIPGDLEAVPPKLTIRDWADDYCSSTAFLKSFTVTKTISNINYDLLKQELKSIIKSTNYRGKICISFSKRQYKITIYPDNPISRWRMNFFIRLLFYLTFLWIITWPILFFMTKKWNVVRSNWTFGFIAGGAILDGGVRHQQGVPVSAVATGPFSLNPNPDNIRPDPDVSERYFCKVWTKAIKDAVHGRRTGAKYLTSHQWRAASDTLSRRAKDERRGWGANR